MDFHPCLPLTPLIKAAILKADTFTFTRTAGVSCHCSVMMAGPCCAVLFEVSEWLWPTFNTVHTVYSTKKCMNKNCPAQLLCQLNTGYTGPSFLGKRGLRSRVSVINKASCHPSVGIHCQVPLGQRRAWLAMHTETGHC